MTKPATTSESVINAQLSVEHNLSDKTLIIFDWDGTLMDSIGLIVDSMHVAGETHGFKTTDKAVKDIIGLSLMNGIKILYPQANDAQLLEIQQTYAEYYIANSHSTPLFEPIERMLQTLQQQSKTLAVATGKKRKGLDRVLDASDSHDYFAITRCADESGSKPDPQMLTDILDYTQQQVSNAVFIGDSIYDIQMATALGMTSIAVNYGTATSTELAAQNPTYQVDTPQALVGLLCG
ncbi:MULTISPECIES: HAD family hydrolase [unclassified Psychrobacter]|uniref:HAD family hydrolase n=1 Tax=unclassified Psychrobacter TaxID=196806 RepID=UPI000C3360DB|nr:MULTISPECIES: HAD-IA family hydrolase [unclassified Psychrobacter]MBA6244018.1 HAD-IA family hydrolase [Psychrobacter sp. Urea-trap-18]MBA6287234.1 HAD-IA family hydrolase [Psychrobacter sp. Urea-trap-16]MBA6318348.1 HAD-IA family hydrolase [Psychrobacter sp. Urea-trap-20]MBA6335292.1 HAD-IA family hydrolase [Psychrobacter sp. Urea-trap-19]PKG60323.1 phosphoglycolate phosphatase [Psychrobacter sp. Choline-3u-12]